MGKLLERLAELAWLSFGVALAGTVLKFLLGRVLDHFFKARVDAFLARTSTAWAEWRRARMAEREARIDRLKSRPLDMQAARHAELRDWAIVIASLVAAGSGFTNPPLDRSATLTVGMATLRSVNNVMRPTVLLFCVIITWRVVGRVQLIRDAERRRRDEEEARAF